MPDHLNQPTEYDAVLGGTNPLPVYGAILGGIDGVKRGIASSVVEVRISALSKALEYGEIGLDLVLQALRDESMQVQLAAYSLLGDRHELQVKQQLENFDDLASDVGVDYHKLRNLLAAGEWSEADKETTVVMLAAARTSYSLGQQDVGYISLTDLGTINQLWIKYSKELFGFSVQKRVWQELGGKVDYETNCRLGECLGWRMNGMWGDYQTLSGHFPSLGLLCQISQYEVDDRYIDWCFGWGEWNVVGWSLENGFVEDGCGAVRFISCVASRLAD